MSRTIRCFLFLMLGVLAACQPVDQAPQNAPNRGTSDPSLVSIEADEVMQIYYQFVDDRGRVRFVPTLDAVPAEWRERVGFVEMSSPPPLSPRDAQRIRQAKLRRMPGGTPGGSAGSSSGASAASNVEIILYGADWCGACRSAKQYMDAQGIDYVERNVDEEQWKQEMVAKAGPGGIPVFDVNGQILRGFSAQRLQQLIQSAS